MTGITPNNRVIPVIFVFYCIVLKIFLLEKVLIYQALRRMAFRKKKLFLKKTVIIIITGIIIIREERNK